MVFVQPVSILKNICHRNRALVVIQFVPFSFCFLQRMFRYNHDDMTGFSITHKIVKFSQFFRKPRIVISFCKISIIPYAISHSLALSLDISFILSVYHRPGSVYTSTFQLLHLQVSTLNPCIQPRQALRDTVFPWFLCCPIA